MSTVEDRLRAATRAAAGTVADGSAPPLRLPAPGRRGTAGLRHRGRRTRWMAPMAAAAAVAAVAAGLIFATGPASMTKPRPAPAASPAAPPAVRLTPRLADGLPAYFLAVPEGQVTRRRANSGTVDVISTVTGRTAAKVTLPGSVDRIAAGRAGLFYAAVLPARGPVRFYRIAYPVKGGGAAVTALPIRAPSDGISYLAVSPDGAELAMATYARRGNIGNVQDLTVASTTTRAERHWRTPRADVAGGMAGISWLADNRTLAFSWSYPFTSVRGSLRLLDTAAPGANLLAGRSVLQLNNAAGKFIDLMISEDGRVLIGTSAFPGGPFGVVHGQPTSLGDVIRFSARTGLASFLYRPPPPHAINSATVCLDPMWVSPSGQQALLTCTSNSPAGPMSVRVLLLGSTGATQLRQLEAVARNDLTAFGS